MEATIGVIGIGAMGKGMIGSLLQKGYQVYAYDPSPAAKEWAAEKGAVVVDSVQAIGSVAKVVFASLPGPSVVEEVVLGQAGLFAELRPGSFVFDTSTIDPATAKRLNQAGLERGISYFDCPVSGGPAGSAAGTLTIMVGGDESKLPEIMPYLQGIGKEIFYLGESGSGQVAKLCHNSVVAVITAALGEAFSVGAKAGVDPHKLAAVIEKGSAHNRVLSVFGPNILYGTYENAIFSLDHMHKDLQLYAAAAREQHVPVLVGGTVAQMYEAAKAQGKGSWDSSAVCTVTEELAGTTIAR
ncbi:MULTISPECIES: NAD(P)-dependent oxidoreductase [Brevibacillus]|uniref:3-hydroxyisobutyrate dehydrogenase n=1 Tax=Brevibacillus parabrevis TaxID=54914 RepID=A0A4Y3PG04_BREPA|nr:MULTISPECIES: NAD(P)-dependent oxidoreductase [Brevibacillus]RNB96000.1 NAD(P)-dependent oxidoreductase [Brevibacillus parabrevis]UED71746.1 NAD(P)-dependent oxidoreductase [Brevibacillus sp. HD3.3A]GEB32403.1 3-hydroxyisobutyrate dehydrogenase [Brevibacillus parabrevis]